MVQLLDTARRPEDPDVDFETLARQIIAVIDGHVLQSMSLGGDDLELMVEQACANIRDSFRSEAPAICLVSCQPRFDRLRNRGLSSPFFSPCTRVSVLNRRQVL